MLYNYNININNNNITIFIYLFTYYVEADWGYIDSRKLKNLAACVFFNLPTCNNNKVSIWF